jgi:hypothetical protein
VLKDFGELRLGTGVLGSTTRIAVATENLRVIELNIVV